jgi:hypothetical protein
MNHWTRSLMTVFRLAEHRDRQAAQRTTAPTSPMPSRVTA